MKKLFSFLLFWPLLSLAQQVTLTWDKPPVPYSTWYVVCASDTVNSPCIPFTFFPGVSGFSTFTQYTFDDTQLYRAMGAFFAFSNPITQNELNAAVSWMAGNPGKLYPGWKGRT